LKISTPLFSIKLKTLPCLGFCLARIPPDFYANWGFALSKLPENLPGHIPVWRLDAQPCFSSFSQDSSSAGCLFRDRKYFPVGF